MFQFLLLKVVGLNLKILWTFQQIYKSAEALEYFQTTKEKKKNNFNLQIYKSVPEKRKVQSPIW